MIKKISVIFILPDLETGGAERIVTTIANHLSRDRFEPKILLLRKQGGYLDFLKDDVEIIDIDTERIRHSLKPILREIYRRKPDIVFSGFGEVNAYLSLFIKLFPKVKFIARETNVVSQHVTKKEIKFFYNFYNNYQQIIAQSDDMKNDLVKHFKISENKIVKINNPVDFDLINRLKEHDIDVDYNKSYKNIVAIGNLSPRKGFDLLLNVMNHLKDQKIKLTILGDGAFKEELIQQKENFHLDNVTFLGKVANPFVYLKNADLFILSSRYEGFPNVLLEAGSCGTYSLANNAPGGINEIIQDKINGEIFPIEDSEGFANKIKEILPQNHSKEEIIESIFSRFSKEIIIKKYESIFDQI